MIELLDLEEWVARLKAQCPLFDNRVFHTVPDVDLAIDSHESPVAFIYNSGDQSDEARYGRYTVRQKTITTVSIEIAVRRTASFVDRFSNTDAQTIHNARIEVFHALIAWKPTHALELVAHESGQLKNKETKVIKWQDDFSTQFLINSE